jgi:hypothetical protein
VIDESISYAKPPPPISDDIEITARTASATLHGQDFSAKYQISRTLDAAE